MSRRANSTEPPPALSAGQFGDAARAARLAAFLNLPAPTATEMGVSDEVAELLRKAAAINALSVTDETRRSYANRWAQFNDWCESRSITALPTTADALILYLQDHLESPGGFSVATARGRVAAISRVNLEAGFTPPTRDPAVSTYLRALSRLVGASSRRRPVKALKTADLRQTLSAIPSEDARAVRDRALASLIAAGLTPAEIAAIGVADVRASGRQVRVRVSGSRSITLPETRDLPARSAVMAWRSMCSSEPQQLFCTTNERGQRSPSRVSAADLQRTIERRMAAFGMPADDLEAMPKLIRLLGRANGLGLRDRALLTVGFSAALRRVDVTTLRWRDVTHDPDGVLLYLAYSKTDRQGQGRTIAIPLGRNPSTCPVAALTAWRLYVAEQVPAGDLAERPIFVTLGRSGALGSTRMCASAVTEVVVRRTAEAQLDGPWGGRSLRAGLITSAVELGIPLEEIAHQSGHKTIESLLLYVRRDDPFARNASSRVGL